MGLKKESTKNKQQEKKSRKRGGEGGVNISLLTNT
jgi:hypothetical protein